MKFHRRYGFLAVLLLAVPCFAHHLAVIVNKNNSIDNVTSAHLSNIFRSEVNKWPDGNVIILVLHANLATENQTLQHLNKMSTAELKAHIAAHKDAIHIVNTDADLLKEVESTPGAIGLVDVRAINEHVKVVKVDGKLPLESGYLPH
jgi:ABC-type phosphate transport system substrate-binding protein